MGLAGGRLFGFEELCEHQDKTVDVDGFGHVDLEPGLKRSAAILASCERGEGKGGYVATTLRAQGADPPEKVVAIFLRHGDVADQHLWSELREYLHRHRRRLGRPNHG